MPHNFNVTSGRCMRLLDEQFPLNETQFPWFGRERNFVRESSFSLIAELVTQDEIGIRIVTAACGGNNVIPRRI